MLQDHVAGPSSREITQSGDQGTERYPGRESELRLFGQLCRNNKETAPDNRAYAALERTMCAIGHQWTPGSSRAMARAPRVSDGPSASPPPAAFESGNTR